MKIVRHLTQKISDKSAVAIGNFDGVHLGHQAVLSTLVKKARADGLQAVAIVFEPQPLEFFQADNAPARLTNFREKMHYLAATGLDTVVCLRFAQDFANLLPDAFIQTMLIERLGVRALFVGEDFRFGRERIGDIALLRTFSEQGHFTLCTQETAELDDARISSTAIRRALQAADFTAAAHQLGRDYALLGRVVHGDKRGRTIGVPTVNIQLRRLHSPLHGVYAVRVHGLGETQAGVANIGTRPTVCGRHWQLEVHLFDWSQDCYGQALTVEPVQKIRDEQKFSSLDDLVMQIEKDCDRTREILAV